ncbi:MAG: hypothetical protein ACYC2K_10660 [Gemmatimonadales bacterium]
MLDPAQQAFPAQGRIFASSDDCSGAFIDISGAVTAPSDTTTALYADVTAISAVTIDLVTVFSPLSVMLTGIYVAPAACVASLADQNSVLTACSASSAGLYSAPTWCSAAFTDCVTATIVSSATSADSYCVLTGLSAVFTDICATAGDRYAAVTDVSGVSSAFSHASDASHVAQRPSTCRPACSTPRPLVPEMLRAQPFFGATCPTLNTSMSYFDAAT